MSDKELTARINVLEAKVTMLYTLRKEEREKREEREKKEERERRDEALALVPDNRVDGNGIRIADLEAVDDELANKVKEDRKWTYDDTHSYSDLFPADPGDDAQ